MIYLTTLLPKLSSQNIQNIFPYCLYLYSAVQPIPIFIYAMRHTHTHLVLLKLHEVTGFRAQHCFVMLSKTKTI